MVYVARWRLTGQGIRSLKSELSRIMEPKLAKAALLVAAMMFFAVLALDIAVPALVLSVMALSIWAVTLDLPRAPAWRGDRMKWFLIFWAGPIVFLGGWYWLSYYDMNFGIFMLTRQVHDLTFQIYGNVLGIPPETIPPLVARAIAVDSLARLCHHRLPQAQEDHCLVEGASGLGIRLDLPASSESLSSAP